MTEPLSTGILSQMSTCWSTIGRAHGGSEEAMAAARRELLGRYGGAVSRYLQGALHDAAAAEELYQEFALRFLRGDFRRAAPDAGRFRDFLKTALVRLVARYCSKRQAQFASLEIDIPDQALTRADEMEQEFLRSWRADLLARAWQALEQRDKESGRPYYQVLRLRVEHSDWSTEQLAKDLSGRLGKPVTSVGLRQTLSRARQAFAGLLLEEVAQSLVDPSAAAIEQELADLHLLEYCRPALARRKTS